LGRQEKIAAYEYAPPRGIRRKIKRCQPKIVEDKGDQEKRKIYEKGREGRDEYAALLVIVQRYNLIRGLEVKKCGKRTDFVRRRETKAARKGKGGGGKRRRVCQYVLLNIKLR